MGYRLALLVTGASGMGLPVRALQTLAAHESVERVHLVVSSGAARVLHHELETSELGDGAKALVTAAGLVPSAASKVRAHGDKELDAPIASGSYRLDGSVVLPCSSSTLGALAVGIADTLIRRAAAVAMKERWPLVLGFRETPLSLTHIENMRRLAYQGATLLPPMPAFYVGGGSLDRFLDAYVLRMLDCLSVATSLDSDLRWSGGSRDESPLTGRSGSKARPR